MHPLLDSRTLFFPHFVFLCFWISLTPAVHSTHTPGRTLYPHQGRLFVVPVLMAIVIQAFGMSTGLLLFVAVDAPLALYTWSELQARPDGDRGAGNPMKSMNGRSRGDLKSRGCPSPLLPLPA